MGDDIAVRLVAARRALAVAHRQAEEAWGPLERGQALPQALQIADRIRLGKALHAEHPGDPMIERTLLVLRARLVRARGDPGDRERCATFLAAQERFFVAERDYLACLREARESEGLSEEAIAAAELVGARMPGAEGPGDHERGRA